MADSDPQATERHRRRLELVWEVALMQFKLFVGGMRDLALIPISIGAAIIGLITGGDEPEQHFRKVQQFWRRTEAWINLLGESHDSDNADALAKPLHRSLSAEFERHGWVRRTVDQLNAALDSANAKTRRPANASDGSADPPRDEPARGDPARGDPARGDPPHDDKA